MNETLARRYALAIFQLASEGGSAARTGSDLRTLGESLFDDESTKRFFLSPVVDRGEKERMLSSAFAGKADEIALHAVLLLVRKRRESLLPEILTQYQAFELQAQGAEPLTVTSAKELSSEELRAMVTRLEQVYGKKFEVRQHVEPDLIGGVRITMGDRRIDGSVAGRLEELTRSLFGKN